MNTFLAKIYTFSIKSKSKRQKIYDILTNAHLKMGGGNNQDPKIEFYRKLCYFDETCTTALYTSKDTLSALKEHFATTLAALKAKAANGGQIRICFTICYSSIFPFKHLFELVCADAAFAPFILVIPDTARGVENMRHQMQKCLSLMREKFPDADIRSACDERGEFIDFAGEFDVLATSQPYDNMTHRLYTIKHAVSRGALPIFTPYAMSNVAFARRIVVPLATISLCWKICADTPFSFDEYRRYAINRGENALLTGYAKMDELAALTPRKKIIIAPHHTISEGYNNELQLSNFFKYSEFFFELFARFPQVDFIFRPHPLLVTALSGAQGWGERKTAEYFERIRATKNVTYQEGGDYLQTFLDSDGIIHDCGSFISEYLYTDNPCCYMVKDAALNALNFAGLGLGCLEHYYRASCEAEILDFVERVVLGGDDPKKPARVEFARANVRVNFPRASEAVLGVLRREFGLGE